jgi:hypothetical protein
MTKPPRAQGRPYEAHPMFDHPLYRDGWVNEAAVRAIWKPLVHPRHPGTKLHHEFPDMWTPLYWTGMTPAQRTALIDTAPWERDQGHNARPRHQWFLDLADAFTEVTFHGFTRDRYQWSIAVEGFDLIAPAERVLESVRWVDRSLASTAFSYGDDRRLHRIGDPGHAWQEREDRETGEDAHDPKDAGRWHHWRWWD